MKNSLEINLNHLDEVCQTQPLLMRSWGRRLARAKKEASQKDGALKLIKAKMSKAIRRRPAAYGLDKVTDTAVGEAVIASAEYQTALAELQEAEYDLDMVKAMVDALHDRRSEIESLVKLHGQMYWAKPNTNDEHARSERTKPIGKTKRQ